MITNHVTAQYQICQFHFLNPHSGNPGTFSWSDGTEFSGSFTKWYRGRLEPRGARSKRVVISENGYWEGVDPLSDVKHGYVCEYDGKYSVTELELFPSSIL